MVKRDFPQTLIPPGINDERSRSILKLFSAMAEEFDFTSLLMRRGNEIPDEALELAVHDFSLEEFFPPDGLPADAVRRLIDRSWDLHEKEGTDEGVQLGQSLLGLFPEITHWWEQEPKGAHDTHQVTVYVQDHLYQDEGAFLNKKVQTASLSMIDATKRWSQDTDMRLGAGYKSDLSSCVVSSNLQISSQQAMAEVLKDFAILPKSCAASASSQFARGSCAASPVKDFHHEMNIAAASVSIQVVRCQMEAIL